MNAVLLRLAVTGSRSAYGRLAGIAGGVAVGVCMLLLLWGGANGLTAQDDRGAWLREVGEPSVSVPSQTPPSSADAAGTAVSYGPPVSIPLTDDTVLMRSNHAEIFRNRLIHRRDVAALDSTTVPIPGVGGPPAPGEYYASPALQDLIETTPRDELGDRYGSFAGTIEDSALPGPDSLIIVTGTTEAELRADNSGSTVLVSGFTTDPYGTNIAAYTTVLALGAIAVFFPVILLISIVTGLGTAERAERYSTLRLVGASPQVVSRLAAAETAFPSLIGAFLGVVLAVLLRPVVAQLPINGTRLFVADLATGWIPGIGVVASVVVVSALTAAHRTIRAGIGPLGVTRSAPETPPRITRLIPLLAGLSMMGLAVALVRTGNSLAQLQPMLILGGFLLILIGIVTVGPWLTLLVSRAGAARTRTAAGVIALNRIRRTPTATFRSVSGLVVAVFVVSVFAGASSVIENRPEPTPTPGLPHPASLNATISAGTTPESTDATVQEMGDLPGIDDVVIGYGPAALTEPDADAEIRMTVTDARALGFTTIPDSDTVGFDMSYLYSWTTTPVALLPAPETGLEQLVPVVIMIQTDGTPEAIDRARTTLSTSGISGSPGTTPTDLDLQQTSTRLIYGLGVLAYLGMVIAVTISGISLAVGTASAVLDRKKVLGLMRLTGMPVSTLRTIVLREAAVPLLTVLALSIGLGFLVAWLVVTGIDNSYQVTWPSSDYFIALGISLVLALTAVIATFGLIRRNTTSATTRFT